MTLSSGSVSDSDQITLTSDTSPGLSPLPVGSTSILTISASIENFNNLNSEGNDGFKFNTIEFSQPQTENFDLTLKDDNEFNDTEGVVNDTLSLIVNPPPTSSITNIRIRFEGSDNEEVFFLTDQLFNQLNHLLIPKLIPTQCCMILLQHLVLIL